MPFWVLIQIAIAVAFLVLSVALAPKAKKQKPSATRDLENPTSEAGRPIPVVFGTLTVKGVNSLWTGERGKRQREVKA